MLATGGEAAAGAFKGVLMQLHVVLHLEDPVCWRLSYGPKARYENRINLAYLKGLEHWGRR